MAYKFCPECGYKFDKEYKFCPECGFQLKANGEIQNSISCKGEELSSLESLFDQQLIKKEQEDKVYQNRLMSAKVLIFKDEFEKAEHAYNEILSEVVDDVIPYIGLIRAISKNFTIFDDQKVNEQIGLLYNLFDKKDCFKADEDFEKYCKERDAYYLKLKEIEEERLREIKRKEEEQLRLQKIKEEKERQLKLFQQKSKEEQEKILKADLIRKSKKVKEYYSMVLEESKVIEFEKINDNTVIIKGIGKMVPSGLGFDYFENTEWCIFNEDDVNLYLIMVAPRIKEKDRFVNDALANIIQRFSLEQLSISQKFDVDKYRSSRAVPGIRLPSREEYSKYLIKIPKIRDETIFLLDKNTLCIGFEKGKTILPCTMYSTFRYYVCPVLVVDKENFIDVILEKL